MDVVPRTEWVTEGCTCSWNRRRTTAFGADDVISLGRENVITPVAQIGPRTPYWLEDSNSLDRFGRYVFAFLGKSRNGVFSNKSLRPEPPSLALPSSVHLYSLQTSPMNVVHTCLQLFQRHRMEEQPVTHYVQPFNRLSVDLILELMKLLSVKDMLALSMVRVGCHHHRFSHRTEFGNE
jgi:hypothetical protein